MLVVGGEETELDSSKWKERQIGKGRTAGPLRAAKQHGGRRSRKEKGQHHEQEKHGNLSQNPVKICRSDQIKEPTPEEVVPTFRSPPGVFCWTAATVIAGCYEIKQGIDGAEASPI